MSNALNALIAERVMGWEWCERLLCWCPRNAGATLNDTRPRSWSPSTDIAAAWEVVEHLRSRSIAVFIGMPGRDGEVGMCLTKKNERGDRIECGDSTAATVPLAICLAAAAAKGVGDDEVQRALEAKS